MCSLHTHVPLTLPNFPSSVVHSVPGIYVLQVYMCSRYICVTGTYMCSLFNHRSLHTSCSYIYIYIYIYYCSLLQFFTTTLCYNFLLPLFTTVLYYTQVATFDDWAEISRALFQYNEDGSFSIRVGPALFFITYNVLLMCC